MRPGGYVQVLRQPFARWCAGLRHDEAGVLLWLLVEANRRHRNPVLTISKEPLAETLGIGWRRLTRIVDRLVAVGAIAREPGVGGLDGRLVVHAYDDVIADGRKGLGSDFAQLSCDDVDTDLDRLGLDRWAVLVLVALNVGSATRVLTGPAAGIARFLGLDRHRLSSLARGLAAAGEIDWRSGSPGGGSACARIEVLDYARMMAGKAARYDPGEVRVDADGQQVRQEEGAGRQARNADGTDGHGRESRPVRGIAQTAPGPLGASHVAHEDKEHTTTSPHARECSTPAEPKAKSGGLRQEAPPAVVDQEHSDVDAFLDDLLDAVNELAEDTGDDRSGPRLAHALAGSTPAVRRLRLGASERLAAGWTPWDLAVETVGTWDLLSASYVDRVLVSRLDALPLSPPEHVENAPAWSPPVVVIEGEPPEAAYGSFVMSPPIADEPAIDAFGAVFGSFSRPRAPQLSRVAIDVEAAPSASETTSETPSACDVSGSEGAPEATPAHDVDQGADGDLCDVQMSAVAGSSGFRKVIDLDVDEATGPPEPAPRPPTPDAMARARAVVEATRGGRRSERGRRPFGAPPGEPRRAFGPPASPETPVDVGLSASEGIPAVIVPATAGNGADGDRFGLRARADEQERARKRLRALGLSA